MHNDILSTLSRLSDADLVARVKSLLGRERDATAQIIAHLAELDTRDVHLRAGYDSLYVYCRDALGFSEWEAYNWIEVARSARRFPVILDMLAEGSLHLTAVRLLAPHLTPSNHRERTGVRPRQAEDGGPGDRRDALAPARRGVLHSPASNAGARCPTSGDASCLDRTFHGGG